MCVGFVEGDPPPTITMTKIIQSYLFLLHLLQIGLFYLNSEGNHGSRADLWDDQVLSASPDLMELAL